MYIIYKCFSCIPQKIKRCKGFSKRYLDPENAEYDEECDTDENNVTNGT